MHKHTRETIPFTQFFYILGQFKSASSNLLASDPCEIQQVVLLIVPFTQSLHDNDILIIFTFACS